jgi:hypothetical protein
MTGTGEVTWHDANQRSIVSELNKTREYVARYSEGIAPGTSPPSVPGSPEGQKSGDMEDTRSPSALDILCHRFGLSAFERNILLLCAGMDLDSSFFELVAFAACNPDRPQPDFSLALGALPDPHWSALSPGAPLRYWRMIEVGHGPCLTKSPLKIDERILHFMTGVQHPDERLSGYMISSRNDIKMEDLVPSHRVLANKIATTLKDCDATQQWPVIQLPGSDTSDKLDIAAVACTDSGRDLCIIPAPALPTAPAELESLIRLCDREAILSSSALLLVCDDLDPSDIARFSSVLRMIDSLKAPLFVSIKDPCHIGIRQNISIVVRRPHPREQYALWNGALGKPVALSADDLKTLVLQFDLSARTIRNAAEIYRMDIRTGPAPVGGKTDSRLRIIQDACCTRLRTRISDLTQHIYPSAGWDDLVLPLQQKEILQTIAIQVRQRMRVYDTWGFAAKNSRGLGISALFAGASGTGKTMAAEVLAHELSLDLYRIDLAQVVSKYIGETEKNLRRVFDAAESGGAILLFDEADALFGKRSEVKDSHDRYANIEISYLLQRMEEYRGLAILTTNMKEALDPAFLRRIRFVVQFPFPDEKHRAMIWERVFPTRTPRKGLDITQLARLNVAGGSIHNIALSAAFLAAEDGGVVEMKHLLGAAQMEYTKMERTLSDTEVRGWV